MFADFMMNALGAYAFTVLIGAGVGVLAIHKSFLSWIGVVFITLAFVLVAGGPLSYAIWCGPLYVVIAGLISWIGRSHTIKAKD